jgi:hypothetical protein
MTLGSMAPIDAKRVDHSVHGVRPSVMADENANETAYVDSFLRTRRRTILMVNGNENVILTNIIFKLRSSIHFNGNETADGQKSMKIVLSSELTRITHWKKRGNLFKNIHHLIVVHIINHLYSKIIIIISKDLLHCTIVGVQNIIQSLFNTSTR